MAFSTPQASNTTPSYKGCSQACRISLIMLRKGIISLIALSSLLFIGSYLFLAAYNTTSFSSVFLEFIGLFIVLSSAASFAAEMDSLYRGCLRLTKLNICNNLGRAGSALVLTSTYLLVILLIVVLIMIFTSYASAASWYLDVLGMFSILVSLGILLLGIGLLRVGMSIRAPFVTVGGLVMSLSMLTLFAGLLIGFGTLASPSPSSYSSSALLASASELVAPLLAALGIPSSYYVTVALVEAAMVMALLGLFLILTEISRIWTSRTVKASGTLENETSISIAKLRAGISSLALTPSMLFILSLVLTVLVIAIDSLQPAFNNELAAIGFSFGVKTAIIIAVILITNQAARFIVRLADLYEAFSRLTGLRAWAGLGKAGSILVTAGLGLSFVLLPAMFEPYYIDDYLMASGFLSIISLTGYVLIGLSLIGVGMRFDSSKVKVGGILVLASMLSVAVGLLEGFKSLGLYGSGISGFMLYVGNLMNTLLLSIIRLYLNLIAPLLIIALAGLLVSRSGLSEKIGSS